MKHVFACAVFAAALSGVAALAETPVERGAYLVRGIAGCGNCHTPFGPEGPDMGKELAGRLVEQNEMFTAIAPNITPAGRVAGWSDAELARAIREGIRPDGSLIGPPMPYAMYRGLGDEDLAAIVAFLRTVPAVENEVPASTYNIPLPPAYGPPVESVTAPAKGETVEYGAYLAGPVAHCMECHTPMGPTGPMLDTDLGRGGFEFHGPWGTSVASNITSHADGLAGYSDDEVKAMIVKGLRPDGSPMMPPMPYGYLAQMDATDLNAIVLYLRSLPALPDG
ncbi:Alcohol dehydrogenase cytochrome c subunit precursor [Pseudoruegeria aquimaris]|uniref:Alcohol dehydrogenase cytochrome c subunit n=1 Tax=Pseudoruegeria aquimaris TaxID=393663 RepID=A0A1Y5T5A6_9RHOB|nr:cytochrome c [Pseudoruegeria aquimaris]SLN55617.1 Alcohol dehydrogenase cytochrome c subunit precursor [Pseudoruegeria aquimaris]